MLNKWQVYILLTRRVCINSITYKPEKSYKRVIIITHNQWLQTIYM